MHFWHILHAAIGLLLLEGRISYRRLRAEFDLSDPEIEALRFELTEVKRLAVDQDGEQLVWAGAADPGVSRPQSPPRPATAGSARLAAPPLPEAPPRSSRWRATPSGAR